MQVTMLEIDGHEEVDPDCLKDHITNYYKQLFGRTEVADMRLDPDLWPANQQIQHADNVALTRPFTLEELDITIKHLALMGSQWNFIKLFGL